METTVPIIDLSSIIGTKYLEKPKKWKDLAKKIRQVLGTVGFLQIINHEIHPNIVN
jgi:isopenicillin N synthase-like dioxygenase